MSSSHSGRDDLMASLDRADQDLAAGRARLLDDGLIASLPEDSRMSFLRHWIVRRDKVSTDRVVWDGQEAPGSVEDWRRWAPERLEGPFVLEAQLAGAVQERDEARASADEAWAWVEKACAAGGWATVFDIPPVTGGE